VTQTPTGPASGSEFIYSFYFGSGLQVAPLNPNTGVVGATVDATPNLYPLPEYSSPAVYGKFIYDVAFDQLFASEGLWTYTITGANGELTLSQNSPSGIIGGNPLIDQKHGRMYTVTTGRDANYATNSEADLILCEYNIDGTDGSLAPGPVFTGQGYVGSFFIPIMDPLGRYIYEMEDTPQGLLMSEYAINASTGALTEAVGSPFLLLPPSETPGFSSALLMASPSGSYLYAFLFDNEIVALSVDSSTGALSSIPGSPFANDLNISGTPMAWAPNGDFLYAEQWEGLSQGSWSYGLQTFAVDPVHGTIGATPLSTYPYIGNLSGGAQIDPSGNVLLSTGQLMSGLTAYSFNISGSTGALTPAAGSPFTLPDEATPPSTSYESSFIVRIP
jgi:hypothetical protein